MKSSLNLTYCLSILITACSVGEKILTTGDIVRIEDEIQQADEDTLVVFDVTDVLFEQSGELFKSKNSVQLNKILESFVNRVSKHSIG